MQDLIAFANSLADEAAVIARQYFRQPVNVDHKTKDDPVTIADRSIEQKLRQMIESRFPDDGILGEEFGTKDGTSGRIWVLDPVDGTKSFIIGRPTFGTLIGLWDGDNPLLGIIDQPISGERWIGAKGRPTTFNGNVVRIRNCPTLNTARIGAAAPQHFVSAALDELDAACDFMSWGGDCYFFALIASGHMDAVIEQGLDAYDYAALVPVVQGAGGSMCDWHGDPLTLNTTSGQVAAFGDQALKEPILSILKRNNMPA